MAIFTNLDRLKDSPTPLIVKPKQSIEQGVSEGLSVLRPTVEQGMAGNIFTNFGEKMSLEDRLKQVYQKTTRHLAQYFVTDLYTDYIKIKPVQPIEHISPIVITLPIQNVNQGGLKPTIIRFIPNQGTVVLNLRSYDVLVKQGTFLSNGIYKSFITTEVVKPNNFFIAPGFGLIQIKFPRRTVNQGLGTDAVIAIGPGAIILRQGVIRTVGGLKSVITVTKSKLNLLTIPDIKIKAPAAISNEVPQGVVIIPFNSSDPNIGNKTAEIKTLKYTADRLLAAVTPRIKHGSEDPQFVGKNGTGFVMGRSYYSDKAAARVNNILLISTLEATDGGKIYNLFQTAKGNYIKEPNLYEKATAAAKDIQQDNLPQVHTNKLPVNDALYKNSVDKGNDIRDYIDLVDDKDASLNNARSINAILQRQLTFPALRQGEIPTRIVKRNNDGTTLKTIVATGKVLSAIPKDYDELVQKVNNGVFNSGTGIENAIATENGDEALLKPGSEVVVKFTRISQTGNPTVSFTAFLQNISDSYNASFTDLKYVGKQDAFKLYGGTTRQLSLSIKAIAMGTQEQKFVTSRLNAQQLTRKINQLLQICVIGEVANETYTVGPVVKFSLEPVSGKGGLYKNLVAVVNSLKVDTQPEENPWDVDSTLPMIYGISFDMSVISTKEGTPFNVNKTFIG